MTIVLPLNRVVTLRNTVGAIVAAILGLATLALRAQIAPDIALGAPAETVIRTYGWPHGRSIAENREIWLYDNFKVILQDGRVVNIAPVPQPTRGHSPVTSRVPVARSIPSPPSARPPDGTASRAPVVPVFQRPQTTTTPAVAPFTPINSPGVPTKTPAQPIPVPVTSPTAALGTLYKPLLTVAVIFCAVVFLAMLSKDRSLLQREESALRAMKVSPSQESSAPLSGNAAPSWEEAIAERLQKTKPKSELTIDLLREIEWKRFELLVTRYFEHTGVRAECTQGGADGGIDIQLFKPGFARPFSFVQCKAWGSRLVKVEQMRGFFGAMAAAGVGEGVFVTTSEFSRDARSFAQANHVTAIDGGDFVRRFHELPVESQRGIVQEITTGDYTTPSCPTCSTKMVWKSGPAFWACPRYPRCRSSPIYARRVESHSAGSAA